MTDVPIEVEEDPTITAIHELIKQCGGTLGTYSSDLTTQMIETSIKMMKDSHDLGQMKLIARALKEMRYAYRIFSKYPSIRRISIFGSARTPEGHPDYRSALNFSKLMAKAGWMCITGAADGIMQASIKGAERESSFGLSIRLPWETPTNSLIMGDPKLMMFRYFFTRKLMFLSHADAVAAFPGGYGTLDELFEVLTLMQTGKSNIVPLVLVEGPKGTYWQHLKKYLKKELLGSKFISPNDENLYYIAKTPLDAKRHILKFYRVYHSSRYVKEFLVIRLVKTLEEVQIQELNDKFSMLVVSGKIAMSDALPEETDNLELPRLIFHHTRKDFGILRALIDRINEF